MVPHNQVNALFMYDSIVSCLSHKNTASISQSFMIWSWIPMFSAMSRFYENAILGSEDTLFMEFT
jgi:hypothetical protein